VEKPDSLNVNVEFSAKASFAKRESEDGDRLRKTTEELFEQFSSETVQAWLGGEFPRDGDIYEWRVTFRMPQCQFSMRWHRFILLFPRNHSPM